MPTSSSRPRTVSIGGATFDLFVFAQHAVNTTNAGEPTFSLPLGAKIQVEKVIGTAGGGAENTSVGLARLGMHSSFVGIMGSDQWGEALMQNLVKEHVDTTGITIVEGETSSFSIILVASTGERVILYDPGTNAHLHKVTFDRAMVESADWVYLNHIQERSCVIEDDLFEMLAHARAPHLTWNPGGCQIEQGVRATNNRLLASHTDLLVLNKEESIGFTGEKTWEGAMRALLAIGTKNVCVTDGKRGAYASDGTMLYHCPAPETNVVDTTGAGDAFGTAMTWALLSGLDLPEALRAGTINAMSVVGAIGAQAGLLTDSALRSRLAHQTVQVVPQSL